MPRFLWFAPLALLSLLLGLWAFRQGWVFATITETDVIETWTAHYVDLVPGSARSDCSARPGQADGVWILVTCVHEDGRRFDFPADRLGRLISVPLISPKPEAPQT